MTIQIKTPFIKLDALIKYSGIADTGGLGKQVVEQGYVFVNGKQELRRGRKVCPGDQVVVRLDEEYVIDVEPQSL